MASQIRCFPAGVNPSHLMNLFTYEKGYCFVYYLSQLCGDPQRFDDFLRVSAWALPTLAHNFSQLADFPLFWGEGTWPSEALSPPSPILSAGPAGHLDWDAHL